MSTLHNIRESLHSKTFEHEPTKTQMSVKDLLLYSSAIDRHLGGFVKKTSGHHNTQNTSHQMLLNHTFNHTEKVVEIIDEDHEIAANMVDHFSGLIYKALTRSLTAFEQKVLELVSKFDEDCFATTSDVATACVLPDIYKKNLKEAEWKENEISLCGIAGPEGKIGENNFYSGKIMHARQTRSNDFLVIVQTDSNNIVKFFYHELPEMGTHVNLVGYMHGQGPSKVTKTFINHLSLVVIEYSSTEDK